jgi:hypothetical protein
MQMRSLNPGKYDPNVQFDTFRKFSLNGLQHISCLSRGPWCHGAMVLAKETCRWSLLNAPQTVPGTKAARKGCTSTWAMMFGQFTLEILLVIMDCQSVAWDQASDPLQIALALEASFYLIVVIEGLRDPPCRPARTLDSLG